MVVADDTAPEIAGVHIEREIGWGSDTLIYRASRGVKTVAVKTPELSESTLDAGRRRRLLREGCLLGCLKHPVLTTIHEVGESDGIPYVVREYIKGRALIHVVEDEPLSIARIVELAGYLADALVLVHEHGLLHRDIQPCNIMIGDDELPKLVDFGLSASQEVEDAQRLEGTVHYLSPEQGGMLDRPIDARSDLYSLGAVLYFCATGEPPYDGEVHHDILSKHATAPIPDPRAKRPQMCSELARLIMALMAKDPGDRPPSARQLAGRLVPLWEKYGDGEDIFSFVSSDASATELVGRRTERKELLRLWSKTGRGHLSFALVEGPSGSGKSHLAGQVIRRARSDGALGVTTHLQSDEPHPLAAVERLFDPIFDYLTRSDDATRREAIQTIRAAVAGRRELVCRAIPRLRAFVDCDDRKSRGGDDDAKIQSDVVYEAIAALLADLAHSFGAMALVIDDGHWFDDATEQILERLSVCDAKSPLLVVLVVDGSRAHRGQIARLAKLLGDRLASRIELEPFDRAGVDALVRGRLAGASVDTELVDRVYAVSRGNAYAVESYLRTMLDAAILRPRWGHWEFEADALDGLDLPENLAQLLSHQLQRLDDKTRRVLSWVALFGAQVTTGELGAITDWDQGELNEAVGEATRAGLLRRESAQADQTWALVHDSVRQGLIDKLDDDELRRRHQVIAESLDDGDGGREGLFQIAQHYAQGQVERNPHRAVEVNHEAGRLARDNAAFRRAFSFFEAAAAIAAQCGVEVDGHLDADLGHVASRIGNLERARKHLHRALDKLNDPVERARYRADLVDIEISSLHTGRAHDELQIGLDELGEQLPQSRPLDMATSLSRWARSEVVARMPVVSRLTRGGVDDQTRRRLEALMGLYNAASRVGFYLFDDKMVLQIGLRQHDLAMRLGDPVYLARTHVVLAFLAAGLGQDGIYEFHLQRAHELSADVQDRTIAGIVDVTTAMCLDIRGDLLTSCEKMFETVIEHGQWLDVWEYATGATILIKSLNLRGHHRRALEIATHSIDELRVRFGDEDSEQSFVLIPLAAMALATTVVLGESEKQREFEGLCRGFFDQARDNPYYRAMINQSFLMYHLERDEFGDHVDQYVDNFESLSISASNAPFYLHIFYVYKAWLMLRRAEEDRAVGKAFETTHLRQALADLKKVATVPAYRAYLRVFEAGLAVLEGRSIDEVFDHLDAAQRRADEVGMPIIDYEVARRRALLHRDRDALGVAFRYLRRAHRLATDEGWENRVRRLRAEFSGELRSIDGVSMGLTTHHGLTSSVHAGSRFERQFDALLHIQEVLGQPGNTTRKLREILDEILTILGAERGFFFYGDEETLNLEAWSQIDTSTRNVPDDGSAPPYAQGVVDQVFASAKPLVITTRREGRRWDAQSFDELRSAIGVPVYARGELRGVAYLDSSLAEGVFSAADIRPLRVLADSLSVVRDADRAHRLQEEVTRAGQQGAALLEHATRAVEIGLATMSAEGELTRATPIVYTVAEPWGSLSQWWRAVEEASQWDDIARCEECGETEIRGTTLADVRTPDNERHVFELISTGHGHELTDEVGEHVLLVRDVTERVEAEEELRALNEDLKKARDDAMAASRAKSAFLANMSHELRTPLNAIIGYSEMLLEDVEQFESAQLGEDLRRIRVSGKHLLELVSDILILSKIETGRVELCCDTVDLASLVDDIAVTAKQLVEKQGNEFVIASVPEVELYNDETKLRQILLNLLGNAAKFTQDGEIRLDIEVEGATIRFVVSDTGIGMSEEQLDSLYDAFYQAQPGSISEHGGTGLGLTISRRFCRLMDGTLEVESELDVGTSFTVEVPLDIRD